MSATPSAAAWQINYSDGSGPRLKVSFDTNAPYFNKHVEIKAGSQIWVDLELLPDLIQMLQEAQEILNE